jgi:hypothetical protein
VGKKATILAAALGAEVEVVIFRLTKLEKTTIKREG